MYKIPFIQYIRPNGKRRNINIECSPELYVKAKTIINKGGMFEAEILTTDEVSLTINYNYEDIAIEVVSNGPEVLKAVERLIDSGLRKLYKG